MMMMMMMMMMMRRLNLQSASRAGHDSVLLVATRHVQGGHHNRRYRSTPSRTCSTIRVLTLSVTCCLTSAAAVTSPCAALPYRWVEGLSPWHLHCSCHGRAGPRSAASRAHEVSGEVHANSRCRAGHREQECALPLCVARLWICWST